MVVGAFAMHSCAEQPGEKITNSSGMEFAIIVFVTLAFDFVKRPDILLAKLIEKGGDLGRNNVRSPTI